MDYIMLPIALAVFFAGLGAFCAFGFAFVCRLLKWSPVNVTVNIHQYGTEEPPEGKI
jgi:hypothetical protein